MPEIAIAKDEMEDGCIRLVKLIATAGFAPSSSEARRLIQSGAVSIDGEKQTDVMGNVAIKDGQILKVGKLKFARLRLG